MKGNTFSLLDDINHQKTEMVENLIEWSRINSFSDNIEGLSMMLTALNTQFSFSGSRSEAISLPSRSIVSDKGLLVEVPTGKALSVVMRPQAKHRILLAGHMDTVYSPSHPFQDIERLSHARLRGPGVADMKGGLMVMLKALETFEKHPLAKNIGWEVLINPDEEVGSVASHSLFVSAAKRNALALVFEPSFPDGAIVSSRKGSCNMTVVARGKSAHAGRDFDKGRNAIAALSEFIVRANKLTDIDKGITINAGYISGGGPVNIVPELAICGINIRAAQKEDFLYVERTMPQIARECEKDGITISTHFLTSRGPKPFDVPSQHLFGEIEKCAEEEGTPLSLRPSGGVCDGNLIAELGLPVIDTLGVIGGEIHTPNEYIEIDSLVTRSRLIARFLINFASTIDAKEK